MVSLCPEGGQSLTPLKAEGKERESNSFLAMEPKRCERDSVLETKCVRELLVAYGTPSQRLRNFVKSALTFLVWVAVMAGNQRGNAYVRMGRTKMSNALRARSSGTSVRGSRRKRRATLALHLASTLSMCFALERRVVSVTPR